MRVVLFCFFLIMQPGLSGVHASSWFSCCKEIRLTLSDMFWPALEEGGKCRALHIQGLVELNKDLFCSGSA